MRIAHSKDKFSAEIGIIPAGASFPCLQYQFLKYLQTATPKVPRYAPPLRSEFEATPRQNGHSAPAYDLYRGPFRATTLTIKAGRKAQDGKI